MIVLLGEAFGRNEAAIGRGFVGASGLELLKMLDEAGVITLTSIDQDYINKFWRLSDPHQLDMVWQLHPEVHRSNVFQQHPPGDEVDFFCGSKATALPGYPALGKSKYVRNEFAHELDRLGDELVELNPNLIVALGNTALWALCGNTGIAKLRGATTLSTHTVANFKVLPVYHPAAVLRQWSLRPLTILDLMKARREAEFPEIRRLKREIWIEPTIDDIRGFYENHIRGSSLLSCDIETAGNQITEIGFAPSPNLAIVIPFVDKRKPGRNYWQSSQDEQHVWRIVREALEDSTIPKLFQNGLYDIAFLLRSMGIRVRGAAEDTMLLHHALQPESLKSLGFLGSLYTDEGAWKQMRTKHDTIKADD